MSDDRRRRECSLIGMSTRAATAQNDRIGSSCGPLSCLGSAAPIGGSRACGKASASSLSVTSGGSSGLLDPAVDLLVAQLIAGRRPRRRPVLQLARHLGAAADGLPVRAGPVQVRMQQRLEPRPVPIPDRRDGFQHHWVHDRRYSTTRQSRWRDQA